MNEKIEKIIYETIEKNMNRLCFIKKQLYESPEIGGEEKLSSALLIEELKKEGFVTETDFHGIRYCFRAEFDSKKEGPVVGLTAEYDALPGIGHGCGHNMIAAASLGAAFALKAAAAETGGRIVVIGTPGEENVCSKVQLADEGAFDELDVVMAVHPSPENLSSGNTLAIDAWQIDFFGKSSHSGLSPEEGVNALDAAVHFYSLIGFEKQYLKGTNIYGVFVYGGEKCSVIPDRASVKYLVRSKDMKGMQSIREMFERCAEAASKATGATYKIWQNEPANKNMISNRTLADVFDRYYENLGGGYMPKEDSVASTDMGDASHVIPAIHPWIGFGDSTLQLHSKKFAEMTMSPQADILVRNGAAALAMTGAEVLIDHKLLEEIKKEFKETH